MQVVHLVEHMNFYGGDGEFVYTFNMHCLCESFYSVVYNFSYNSFSSFKLFTYFFLLFYDFTYIDFIAK